jgi:hypothetical protein
MNNVETYKGVRLTSGKNAEMIDTIIEKYDTMKASELAFLVGLPSIQSVYAIRACLNKENARIAKEAKESKKTNESRFKNHDGNGKKIARNYIADAIMETKVQSSNILTLPCDEWIMEKKILAMDSRYKFTAVEYNGETYMSMIENMVADKTLFASVQHTHKGAINEVLESSKEDTFSSAILDYCGHIDTFYDEIDHMMKQNLIRNGGYITITLSDNSRLLNHPHHKDSHSNKYIKKCCLNKDMTGKGLEITKILVDRLICNNNGYEIVNEYTYKDTTTKMMLFIIKRVE